MKVLVTGGAGFIGAHTVNGLIDAGASVRVFDNFSTGRRDSLHPHACVEVVEGDIRDSAAVAAALRGVSHVLHLAAQVSVQASLAEPRESMAHNIAGFVTVLDAARQAGVRRFVYASSAAVYGDAGGVPVSEASPTHPLSPYALEKLVNEQYGALYGRAYGMPSLGMRYFNVYGPGQDPRSPYSGVVSIFADRIGRGEPLTVFGDGRQTRDFIYVADVVRANLAALSSDIVGICNVATGASVELLDLAGALGAVAGRRPAVHHAPQREGDIRHSAAAIDRLRHELAVTEFTPLATGLDLLWTSTQ